MDYAVAKWMDHFEHILAKAENPDAKLLFENHEVTIQELVEAVHDFLKLHIADFRNSRQQANGRQLDINLQPNLYRLLEPFKDARPDFESLRAHIVVHRSGDSTACNAISLKRIREAVAATRMDIEATFNDPRVKDQTLVPLREFYGSKVFKCSRLTCFYFHEGFTDSKTRDKHLGRHERPFLCNVPDCTSAEIGFGSKQDLKNHIVQFHADTELKSQMFTEAMN